jgi:carbamoyl-phosphate synthase large subunit
LPEQIHILMTGAGAPGAPGIIRCLLQDRVVKLTVADANDEATGKYLHHDFIRIPHSSDPLFIDQVMDICKRSNIQLIMPLVTKELFEFSGHKERFEKEGIKILVSSKESIAIANNKSECYKFLLEKGIAVPRFYVTNTLEEFIHAAFELGYPERSFCFKPSLSNGSRGVRIVDDSINETDQLFNEKPYNLFITYSHALNIFSSGIIPELLVSENLPGEEYSVDCLCKDGEALLVVPRLRKKMINGISVEGEFVKDEAIIEYCREIIKAIKLHGNIGIQVKRNENGEALLLEINPRVQGTIVAGLGAGVNLPLLAVKQELGLEISAEEINIKWGTRFRRFWSEVYY